MTPAELLGLVGLLMYGGAAAFALGSIGLHLARRRAGRTSPLVEQDVTRTLYPTTERDVCGAPRRAPLQRHRTRERR